MRSTLSGSVPEYIGADLTDRYSAQCREIDVCGLTWDGQAGLRATFWHWHWDPAPQSLEVAAVVKELRAARVAMLDGPQALARRGATLRDCERQSAAVDKTPDRRPGCANPFAGFICSSLELFAALKNAGLAISPPLFVGGVSEVYPGHVWTVLAGGWPLPKKSTDAGLIARKRILEALGVSGLPVLPTHDQNDACVAALVAAAADGTVSDLGVRSIGAALSVDVDGTLRERPMVVPLVAAPAAIRIAAALRDISPEPPPARASQPDPASQISADELLETLISKAVEGDPQVGTYGWAYRVLFNVPYVRFSQAYARKVIDLARQTRPRTLPGLGIVRLDAFIVSKKDGRPADGYWPAADHDREDWERALGRATIVD